MDRCQSPPFAPCSLRTTLCVRYPPETIACGAIYLAGRVLQRPLPEDPPWWTLFDAPTEGVPPRSPLPAIPLFQASMIQSVSDWLAIYETSKKSLHILTNTELLSQVIVSLCGL